MKRLFLTISVMMMCLTTWAQNDEMTRAQADKLDSITVKLMNQQRYEDAIKAKERELTILKTLYGEKDSTYICQLAFRAKLYYRNKQVEEAVKIVERLYSFMPTISVIMMVCMRSILTRVDMT